MNSQPDTFPIPDRRTLLLRGSLVLLAAAAGMLFFFRAFIFSGGEWITGDMADGRLILAIHEHWFRWLQGKEGWFDLGFFYPDRNALVYSDTFLLGGMIHSLLRSAGNDPYLAFQLTQMVMAVAGFAGMFTWLLAYRRAGFGYALFGAFMMLVASPIFFSVRNSHIQLQAVWLVPWLAVLLEQAWRDSHRTDRRLAVSFLMLCTLYGLMAYSTFYISWFTLLFGVIWTCSWLVLHGWRAGWHQVRRLLPRWKALLPGMLAGGLFLALFLATYLDVRMELGGRSLKSVAVSIPQPWDLFNHSASNLLWGKIFANLYEYAEGLRWELEVGPTLLFTICVIIFAVSFLRQREGRDDPEVMLQRTTALAVLVSFCLIVRIGVVTLWAVPYFLVPGASGIRAVLRYAIFLVVPATYLLVCGLRGLRQSIPGAKGLAFVSLLGALVLLEQGQTIDLKNLNRRQELETLAKLPPKPGDAAAFAAFGHYTNDYVMAVIHNSAIVYAQHYDLPTLSGRSGFVPANWGLFEPKFPEIYWNTIAWARHKGITGNVYFLDVDKLRWDRGIHFPVENGSLLGVDLSTLLAEDFERLQPLGWSKMEHWGVWSEGSESQLILPDYAGADYPLKIEIRLHGFVNDKHPRQRVRVEQDGRLLGEAELLPYDSEVTITGEVDRPGARLVFTVDAPASPAALGMWQDERVLGIGLTRLLVTPR